MSSSSAGSDDPPPVHDAGTPDVGNVDVGAWRIKLADLCARIRDEVRGALLEVAAGRASRADVADAVGVGAGDVTFALDGVAERAVEAWLDGVAREGPLSLMTEDTGWRHVGPGPDGGVAALDGFDHGGPRIALDPIDGTRNVMHDLRPAWVVVSCAGPGSGQPRFGDLCLGMASEIPDTRGAGARELDASRGGGAFLRLLPGGERQALASDEDGRLDRGYFPFFGYSPTGREAAQRLCADVFADLQSSHDIDSSTVLDDQYISSGGQLALLAMGTYRAIVDARVSLNRTRGLRIQTAKPYDMAGAALVAIEAGCVVTAPDGTPLDFPIDTKTEVEFAGYRNARTAAAIAAALQRQLS